MPSGTSGHWRIREDRIDDSAPSPSAITHAFTTSALGAPHKRTRVRLLIHNDHIRIINANTGELINQLIIDPTRDYQPQKPQNALPKESELS